MAIKKPDRSLETKLEKKFRYYLIKSGFHVWPKCDGFSTPDVMFECPKYSYALEIKKRGNNGVTTKRQKSFIKKLQSFKRVDNFIIKMIDYKEVEWLLNKKITTTMLLNLQDMTKEN